MTARTSRWLAAAAAVVLLAGCGGGSTRAGAAATVGEERIAADELEQVVSRGLEDPAAQEELGADRAEYQRQVLNRMVRAELLEEAARENGVEVTAGDVDARLAEFAEQAGSREELDQQAAAAGIAPQDLERFVREVALEIALGDALTEDVDVPDEQIAQLYQQNLAAYDQVRTRHILVEDEAQARDLLAQVQADRSRFEALAAEFSIDEGNADSGGDLGLAGRGQFVPPFEEAVFGAAPGDVVLVQTEFGWHVVEVLERQTTTQAQARDELRRQVLGEQRQGLVLEELRSTGEELGVEVNPRFGRWDAEEVEVAPVPEDDGLSKPAPDDGSDGSTGEGTEAPAGEPAPETAPQ